MNKIQWNAIKHKEISNKLAIDWVKQYQIENEESDEEMQSMISELDPDHKVAWYITDEERSIEGFDFICAPLEKDGYMYPEIDVYHVLRKVFKDLAFLDVYPYSTIEIGGCEHSHYINYSLLQKLDGFPIDPEEARKEVYEFITLRLGSINWPEVEA